MRKFVVTVEDEKYQVMVEEVGGAQQNAPSKPEVPGPAPQAAPANVDGQSIKAPLAGTILSVKVNVGDQVTAGTVVATLEALKLENEVPATQAGTVKAVLVSPGQTVSTGDPLVVLE
jgi:biotin carboxyl carrier protein